MAAQQGWCTQFSYLEDIDNNASGGVAQRRTLPGLDVPLLLITVKGFGRMKIGQSVRKVKKITPSRGTYFCFFVSFCLHNGQVLVVISFQKFSIPGYQWTPMAN